MLNSDPVWEKFIQSYQDALRREKFNRPVPYNNTPSTIGNTFKFYYTLNGRDIFVSYPDIFFEKVLLTAWSIVKSNKENQEPKAFLRAIFEDHSFQAASRDLSWSESYEKFVEALREESYFYFDDSENQYYFNFFRILNEDNSGFTGGVLHPLIKHYENFSLFSSNPKEKTSFEYGSFFADLILCSVFGKTFKCVNMGNGNFNTTKELKSRSKYLVVGLFWDELKQLFFLKTFYQSNKSNFSKKKLIKES